MSKISVVRYEWRKNDADMNLNDYARLEVENGGSTVVIKAASSFDEGFYQCTVSTTFGKAMSNTTRLQRATVGDPALKTITSLSVLEGQPFTIEAQGQKCFPKPTYSWEVAEGIEDNKPSKVIPDKRVQMDENGV